MPSRSVVLCPDVNPVLGIDRLGHTGDASDLMDDPAKDFKAEWEVSPALKSYDCPP
jgi:hypothetical protein